MNLDLHATLESLFDSTEEYVEELKKTTPTPTSILAELTKELQQQ